METGKAQKNKQTRPKAAVIKPSLVLVMHRSAAKRQTWPSSLTEHGQSLEQRGHSQGPFGFSTSVVKYRKMAVLDQFGCAGTGGKKGPLWLMAKGFCFMAAHLMGVITGQHERVLS